MEKPLKRISNALGNVILELENWQGNYSHEVPAGIMADINSLKSHLIDYAEKLETGNYEKD